MNDRLPNIQIKVNTDLSEFLEQLQKVALEAKNYQVEFHRDFLGQGYDILEVAPKVSMSHIGLLGQFIVGTDKKRNVSVEIKANRWKPEPPTYEMYVKAAKEIVVPLLKSYNALWGTNYRLSIQSTEDLKARLPPKAEQRFNEFVVMANKQILHPFDWKRFYYFIYACSSKNIKTTQDDVKELLLLSDFSDEVAEDLANIFWHGVSLLRLSKG